MYCTVYCNLVPGVWPRCKVTISPISGRLVATGSFEYTCPVQLHNAGILLRVRDVYSSCEQGWSCSSSQRAEAFWSDRILHKVQARRPDLKAVPTSGCGRKGTRKIFVRNIFCLDQGIFVLVSVTEGRTLTQTQKEQLTPTTNKEVKPDSKPKK